MTDYWTCCRDSGLAPIDMLFNQEQVVVSFPFKPSRRLVSVSWFTKSSLAKALSLVHPPNFIKIERPVTTWAKKGTVLTSTRLPVRN